MKREIKFRGLQKVGKFAYGKLLSDGAIGRWGNSNTYNYADVNPETVGQYIGLKDIKGIEIYEGDKTANGYVIRWNEEKALFAEHLYQEVLGRWSLMSYPIDNSRIEIVGNIYENTTD